jgi:alpha-L-fucosidase
MKKNYPPDFTYQDFARDFTAECYNPDEWAEILQASGAKYDISLYMVTSHLTLDIFSIEVKHTLKQFFPQ